MGPNLLPYHLIIALGISTTTWTRVQAKWSNRRHCLKASISNALIWRQVQLDALKLMDGSNADTATADLPPWVESCRDRDRAPSRSKIHYILSNIRAWCEPRIALKNISRSAVMAVLQKSYLSRHVLLRTGTMRGRSWRTLEKYVQCWYLHMCFVPPF